MTTTQLDFWEKLYATLAHMAQDILIIPASSTRFFPKVEYASSDRRTNWQVQTRE